MTRRAKSDQHQFLFAIQLNVLKETGDRNSQREELLFDTFPRATLEAKDGLNERAR